MIYGIGVDIASIDHFQQMLADPATQFLATHFTAGELAYARAHASEDPARHLAARYAAKETVVKAVAGRWSLVAGENRQNINYREIEIVSSADGAPRLVFHGQVAEAMKTSGVTRSHLSLSHDAGMAVAMVVLEK